jgi:hypothetical protein
VTADGTLAGVRSGGIGSDGAPNVAGMAALALGAAVTGLLCACVPGPLAPSASVAIDDESLLQLAYSSYKLPDGFYQEDLHNVIFQNAGVMRIHPLGGRASVFERCTNDRSEALAWSESPDYYGADDRQLVSERETERFFEFTWEVHRLTSRVLLSRVDKCSYVDRSMYDRRAHGTMLGIFNQRPVTADNVGSLVEYLWYSENFTSVSAKVISSSGADLGSEIRHTLVEVRIAWGDWGMCDEISLVQSDYLVSKSSGEIRLTTTTVKTVQGQCQ